MGRIKKFLYLYFTMILMMIILSALGAKTIGGDMSPIEYFLSGLQPFCSITLFLFVLSLFL